MKKYITSITLAFLLFFQSFAQSVQSDTSAVYKINWKIDAPVTTLGLAGTALGFMAIDAQSSVSMETLNSLDKNDINSFDRPVAGNYSVAAERFSDVFFFGSFPYGLVLLADKKARKEAGKIGLMYLQAMSLSAASYALTAGNTNRFRPELYNRTDREPSSSLHGRNSFYAGHPSMVATSTVFVAKVFSDLHPENNFKYALWGVAASTSLTTAYLRMRAGKHFPTDLITGLTISSTIGFLVPHLHKIREKKKKSGETASTHFTVTPFSGQFSGLSMRLTF